MTDDPGPLDRSADARFALSRPPGAFGDDAPVARSPWRMLRTIAMTLITAAVIGLKYLAGLKTLAIPLLKFLPLLLKTGGTMVLSVMAYTLFWGWEFALGFVILLLIHECGHLLVARSLGLKVGAPVFIPFMGAFIALKDAPRNAWVEALVGIGGPLMGAVGALTCGLIGWYTGSPFWFALAYSGCLLNLFNLIPIGTLDGGRIVTALSPWLWLVGSLILGALLVLHPNLLLGVILILSLPRLWSLFRPATDAQRRYFEVTAGQRLAIGLLYIGLAGALAWGMAACQVAPPDDPSRL